MRILFTALAVALLLPALASAQISYSTVGGSYTQNFDTLTTTTAPAQAWTNDSTLSGWFLFNQTSGGTAITTYLGGTGSSTTGSFYSFGAAAVAERALGGLASGGTYFGSPLSGSVAGWIAVSFTNNTGSNLDSITLTYNGEQWRDGGATTPTAQTMVLEYGFGATFTTVGTWTPAGSGFNFTSPVFTTAAAAVDGNVAGRVNGIGGSFNATWNIGETLWIRYIENNDTGNDHGLALDDFSFSATTAAVPEPATYGLLALTGICSGGAWYYRRRKLNRALAAKVK